jgi:hypothetical protein
MRRLVLGIAASIALIGCQGPVSPTLTAPPQAQAIILVAAPSGSTYAAALIGPIVLDVEVVGGVTCYNVKLPASSDGHGVVWPFGTVARGDSLLVPGLTEPLMNGDTFWAGGGSGDSDPALGPCNKPPNYFVGPTVSRTDPRATP